MFTVLALVVYRRTGADCGLTSLPLDVQTGSVRCELLDSDLSPEVFEMTTSNEHPIDSFNNLNTDGRFKILWINLLT